VARRAALTANQRFVNQLYLDLLQRPADAAGLAALSRLLDRGTSRTAVAREILDTVELRGRVIGMFYQEYLGRDVDTGGLRTLLEARRSGATFDQSGERHAGSAP